MTTASIRVHYKYYMLTPTTGLSPRSHSYGHKRMSFTSCQSAQVTPTNNQSRLTDFNVAVSVLSMFVLLVKSSMFILHIWYPILSTLANLPIVVLWAVSVYGQMGPDHSDPKHPSNIAWYITRSCSYARPSGNYGYCMQAKGSFAVTVVMLYVFSLPLNTPSFPPYLIVPTRNPPN
jgi:hypothetical protein